MHAISLGYSLSAMHMKCVAKMLTSSAAFSTGSAYCDHISSHEQESDTNRARPFTLISLAVALP